MLNQTKRVFTHKSKSKIFITILCIFGLLFSWSCSCKNNVTGPGNDGLENGKMTNANGGIIITPSMSLSRDLMVVNSAGNDTTYKIAITVADADFEIADITGEVGLTKDDFTLNGGVLSLTKSFDKLTDNAEKTLTLTVNYKKKSTAGANDTLSKTTDTQTFKIIKAQKVTDSEITTDFKALLTVGDFAFDFELKTGIGTVYESERVDYEMNTGDFVTQLKTRIKDRKNHVKVIADVDFISVDISTDKRTATFSFILRVKEQYETTYNDAATPLKLKVVIGADTTIGGQGGTGTWKDTSTPQS